MADILFVIKLLLLQWWRQEETREFLCNNGFPYLLQTDHNNYGMIITINLYMNHYVHENDNDDGQISNNNISEIRISHTDIKMKNTLRTVCMWAMTYAIE